MEETPAFDHSNESHREVFSCVSVHYILQGGFNHKPLNLAGRTVIHSLLNWPIIFHVLIEGYSNVIYLERGITV